MVHILQLENKIDTLLLLTKAKILCRFPQFLPNILFCPIQNILHLVIISSQAFQKLRGREVPWEGNMWGSWQMWIRTLFGVFSSFCFCLFCSRLSPNLYFILLWLWDMFPIYEILCAPWMEVPYSLKNSAGRWMDLMLHFILCSGRRAPSSFAQSSSFSPQMQIDIRWA